MKTKILALLFFLVSTNAFALNVRKVHVDVHKALGVPTGLTIKANFNFTRGDVVKLSSLAVKAALCSPAAAAIIVAGLGPEDPVADVAAIAAEAGCVWLAGKVIDYALKKTCKKGVTAVMGITESIISVPPGSPYFRINRLICRK